MQTQTNFSKEAYLKEIRTRKRKRLMAKRRKRTNRVLGVIGFLGFFLLLGTVGALECDTIGIAQFWKQALIGLGMFGGAVILFNYINEKRR